MRVEVISMATKGFFAPENKLRDRGSLFVCNCSLNSYWHVNTDHREQKAHHGFVVTKSLSLLLIDHPSKYMPAFFRF